MIIRCYEFQAEYKKAVHEAREYVRLYEDQVRPSLSEPLIETAGIYYDRGRYEIAQIFYQAMPRRSGEGAPLSFIRFRLAKCAEELGKAKIAVMRYQSLIKTAKDPRCFNQGMLNMARLLLDLKRYKELDLLLTHHLSARPDSPVAAEMMYDLFLSALGQGKQDQAKDYLEQIEQKYPNTPGRYLADVLLRHLVIQDSR